MAWLGPHILELVPTPLLQSFPISVNAAHHTVSILYFAWEEQSEKVCCIDHKVVIYCITVLYEPYSTVMLLIGHIQHCYAFN